jgi:hypothetical protein
VSATILAAKIVSEWDELSRESKTNRETYLRNLFIAQEIHVANKVIADITEEIKP